MFSRFLSCSSLGARFRDGIRWRLHRLRQHRVNSKSAPIRTTCRFRTTGARGFENRISQLVASELGATVKFVWMPEWRGFVRKGLKAGLCDVIPGVPNEFRAGSHDAALLHGELRIRAITRREADYIVR